jgi:hypothetical protein
MPRSYKSIMKELYHGKKSRHTREIKGTITKCRQWIKAYKEAREHACARWISVHRVDLQRHAILTVAVVSPQLSSLPRSTFSCLTHHFPPPYEQEQTPITCGETAKMCAKITNATERVKSKRPKQTERSKNRTCILSADAPLNHQLRPATVLYCTSRMIIFVLYGTVSYRYSRSHSNRWCIDRYDHTYRSVQSLQDFQIYSFPPPKKNRNFDVLHIRIAGYVLHIISFPYQRNGMYKDYPRPGSKFTRYCRFRPLVIIHNISGDKHHGLYM